MKIVIAEGGPAENVGSMALIENAIKIARLRFPNAAITVLTPTVDSVQHALEKDNISGIKVIDDLFCKPPSKTSIFLKLFWLIQNVVWIALIRLVQFFKINPTYFSIGKKKKVLEEINSCSYIFCIGAERINDVFIKTLFLSLEALRIYQRSGKKLIHFSLTIGPLFHASSMRKASVVLNNSHAIFVRDQKSFEWLEKLKVTSPAIYNSYDVAILQDTSENKAELLAEFGIQSGYIGVSFIEWAFKKVEGPVRMEGYVKAVAATLDYIADHYNYPIVFVPTVVSSNGYKVDDVEAFLKVVKEMKRSDAVIIIRRLLTPKEMSTILSECRFSIVTRMHAAILCSAAGKKPIIAINYLYKLREYMKNIGFEHYSVDIDYVNANTLIEMVDGMEKSYDENVVHLHSKIDSCTQKLKEDVTACFLKQNRVPAESAITV